MGTYFGRLIVNGRMAFLFIFPWFPWELVKFLPARCFGTELRTRIARDPNPVALPAWLAEAISSIILPIPGTFLAEQS